MARKILIVRFSSIGDIVLTTPVIRCVARQTDAEVHFLTKAAFSGVLAGNPYLTRLWTIRKDVGEIATELAAEGFTDLIDLHGNLRTRELKTRLALAAARHLRPRPRSRTFAKLNWQKFLLTRFGVDRMPDVHVVDRYLATVAHLGVTNDGAGLDYFVAPADEIDLTTAGLPARYVAFVIGAAHATKRLPEEQIIAVCRALPLPAVLLGGPAEADTGARIAAASGATNACGRYSLAGSADLVRQATVVLTHDTGLMHVAAAYRKPIVSVWGNTVPALGMYPYLPGQEAQERERRQEVTGLACRPCSKIGYAECPRGHFRCMREQDPHRIAETVARVLQEVALA